MQKRSLKMALLTVALSMVACLAYAGEKCKECHPEISAKHATTLHGKAGKDCEACHGGGDVHMGNPSKTNIIRFGKGDVKAQNAQCQTCHAKNQNLMFWENSKHNTEDVACVSCHAVHKTAKPAAEQPEKCFECHKDVRSQANMLSHHPIIEGKVKCSDCHNPHGTLGHGMIKAENVNQLCYKCHADKRGPFVYEHPPVEEDCMKCHAPHGTKATKLTKEKQPNLCQNCHEGSSHPTTMWTQADSFAGSKASKSGRFFGRSCVNCHQTIHGTNAPAGKRFIR